jgi:transposase InsO family protein
MSKIICYTCNKPGHYVKDCFNGKRKGRHHASTAEANEEPQGKRSREFNIAEQKKKQIILISALMGSISNSKETWLVDSGASRHMMGYRCALIDLMEHKSFVEVEMEDETTYSIQGIGSTSFRLDSSTSLKITKILYVPGINKNLLSVSTLEDKGFRVTFMEGKALLLWHKDSSLESTIEIGVRVGGLYKLLGHPNQVLVHKTVNLCELWHRRFCHLHYGALPKLQNSVTGMPDFLNDHDGVCRGCVLGKNVKGSFPSSGRRSKGILDLVHSDICGPMSTQSLFGYLYYVLFIDDFSWKTRIFFLKTKNETLGKFQEFKALVENQYSREIRALRSDNGGEYTFGEFNDFYRKTGIKRELIVPYNPQQNGVAERKNRTVCEASRAMMCDQDLPASLWAEATGTAVYVQNKCHHAILDQKTPEEVFTGEKPDIGHLRIFGCTVYVHVLKEKRTKMEPSRKKGIFVGYNKTSKAFRIYVLGQR